MTRTCHMRDFIACTNRPVDSHSGARGNILAGTPNIFAGPLLGENCWIFLFKKVHSGVLYIFERRQGPLNVAGPGVAYPLPHRLDGPVYKDYELSSRKCSITQLPYLNETAGEVDWLLKTPGEWQHVLWMLIKSNLPILWLYAHMGKCCRQICSNPLLALSTD